MSSDANQSEQDPLVGSTIDGSYLVLRVVGEGGMGTVYEARHTRIGARRFAIKTLHAQHLRDDKAVARFQREAEAAATVSSPYVAGVVDVGTVNIGSDEDGTPYIVGEFLDGEDLGAHLDRVGRLNPTAIVRLARQVCKGLAAAHARGVVHRDIKPENIFLTGDAAKPTARIVDFGISRVESAETQLTKTGMIIGTPAYMSPEQARGMGIDERTDIYAVAAVIYRALTGSPPFDKSEPAAMIAAVLLEDPEPIRSFVEDVDDGLELVVQRAMAKEPSERYQTIVQLDAALAPYDIADEPAGGMVVQARTLSLRQITLSAVEGVEARFARPKLLGYVALAFIVAMAAAWTLAGAIAAFVRDGEASSTLTSTESSLVALTLVLVAMTPGVLVARHLWRVWGNTPRILSALGTFRRAVAVTLFSYGALAVLIRCVEAGLLRRATGAAWLGWDVFLVCSAAFAGAVAMRWVPGHKFAAWLRRPAGAGALSGIVVLLALLIGVARTSDGELQLANGDRSDETSSSFASDEQAPPKKDVVQLAPPALITSAEANGTPALIELSKRYPKDPNVLRALTMKQGGVVTERAAALKTLERLLKLDKRAAADPSVQRLVRESAKGPLAQADIAFRLMSSKMGSHGPDLLYELSSNPQLRTRAEASLAEPKVQKLATPALRIALDLKKAQGCPAIAKLLERATKDGDKRSLPLLQRYVATSTYRCGFLRLKTCRSRPKCPTETAKIHQAIQAIRTRGG